MAKVTVYQNEVETREAVRQIWQYVETPEAWEALTAGQRSELIRRVIKWLVLALARGKFDK